MIKLYLNTLTSSTKADFHEGRVKQVTGYIKIFQSYLQNARYKCGSEVIIYLQCTFALTIKVSSDFRPKGRKGFALSNFFRNGIPKT